jgi:hypothetical protein
MILVVFLGAHALKRFSVFVRALYLTKIDNFICYCAHTILYGLCGED